MKQVQFGKNTVGYDNYLAAVPKYVNFICSVKILFSLLLCIDSETSANSAPSIPPHLISTRRFQKGNLMAESKLGEGRYIFGITLTNALMLNLAKNEKQNQWKALKQKMMLDRKKKHRRRGPQANDSGQNSIQQKLSNRALLKKLSPKLKMRFVPVGRSAKKTMMDMSPRMFCRADVPCVRRNLYIEIS